MDWRIGSDYDFCDQLDLAGWAWQYLRREPGYRADYARFMILWQQLEAEYGAPPNRDFFKWKQDPRAWRSQTDISDCGTEICPSDDNLVLIECWMGAKWGFRQFPIDPDIATPNNLAWREFAITVDVLDAEALSSPALKINPEDLLIKFDLSLPLPPQLEAAKHQLIKARQTLAPSKAIPPKSLREGAPVWKKWLRLLDGLEAGANLPDIALTLGLTSPESEAAAAISMRAGGYRRLLKLAH